MTVSKKNLRFIIGDILCLFVVLVFKLVQLSSFDLVFLLATAIYAYMMFSWLLCSEDKLNYFTLIILLSYLYYFGQYLLSFLGVNLATQYNINNTFSHEIINSTALYILLNIVVLHLSVLLFQKTTRKIISHKNYIGKKEAFKYVSLILLLLSFVCEIVLLLYKISINRISGYAVALGTNYAGAGGFSYIINFLSTLYLPAFFASLVATKERKIQILPWATYVVFIILYFMSGSRFEVVVSMAGVLLLINYYYKKIHFRKLIMYGVIGLVVLFICSLMSYVRIIENYGSSSNYEKILQKAFESTNDGNFITHTISEAGFQILSVTAVYENCPKNIEFSYGTYYLGGMIRIIPNFLGGENKLITASIDDLFRKYLTKTYGMGSSFIAEAYYNFGYLGIFMMVFYGYLISYISEQMENIRQKRLNDEILIYFIFYIAATSLFWIRSDARFLLREIVFYYYSFRMATWGFKCFFIKNNKLKNKLSISQFSVDSRIKLGS